MVTGEQNLSAIRQQRLELIYSSSWQTKLRGFVRRKYENFGDWESWFEEAHQNLALKIDRLPEEREVSDALIYAVFKNELVSVKRNKLGYPRPRKWLLELSDLGQQLFEWLCLKKLSRADIVSEAQAHSLSTQANSATAEGSSEFKQMIESILDLMVQKKECDGVRPMLEDANDENAPEISAEQPSTEEEADLQKLQLVLQLLIGDQQAVEKYLDNSALDRLTVMRDALQDNPLLSDTDTLILRCYYFQGASQNDIAKMLKQPLQRVVRQREAAIKRLREFMESHGLDKKSLL